MKPAPFHYEAPEELRQALSLLVEHRDAAAILAGGQSLVPLLNLRMARPDVVIDINRLTGLDDVETTADGVRVGALVRAERLVHDRAIAAVHPLLAKAVASIGHPQIRNRTTIGGNLAHADPASELPAVLAATDGWITLADYNGSRRMGWRDFFIGPYMTARRAEEMVVAVDFPHPEGMDFMFIETSRRPGDYALAGVCAGLRVVDGIVAEARIALFGVGSTVVRATEAEQEIRGRAVDEAALSELRRGVADMLTPADDLHAPAAYRRHLAGHLAGQAIGSLWQAQRA